VVLFDEIEKGASDVMHFAACKSWKMGKIQPTQSAQDDSATPSSL